MAAEKAKPKEKAPKDKVSVETPATIAAEAPAKIETPAETRTDAPKNYSRGEGQKAVTQAYKDNWDAIYRKKKKKKR